MGKRRIVALVFMAVVALMLAGCLNYKDFKPPAEPTPEDASLVDEIAQIEEQLKTETPSDEPTKEVETEVEEEVILPEVEESVEEASDLQVVKVKENELVRLKVAVTDPDKDKVTYTFSRPLDAKGEWKTNYGDAGDYIVTITATDGKLTTEKKVKLAVERVNVPPVLEGVKDLTVKEGETVKFQPKASDPNKDEVTLTVSKPLEEGTWETDHTSAGEYQIKVVASDGEMDTEKSFTLNVLDVNVPPELSGLEESISVKEGDVVELNPTVNDLDGDKVTVTISEPVGNDGVWETGYTDHGEYFITVMADDTKDKVTKRVRILVEDVNVPPEIVDVTLG